MQRKVMKIFKKMSKLLTIIGILFILCLLFNSFGIHIYAQELTENEDNIEFEVDSNNYTGYGCNNGNDLQENLNGSSDNTIPEFPSGFGCGSTCGASREEGYSASYPSGCRNWQVMPIIYPFECTDICCYSSVLRDLKNNILKELIDNIFK